MPSRSEGAAPEGSARAAAIVVACLAGLPLLGWALVLTRQPSALWEPPRAPGLALRDASAMALALAATSMLAATLERRLPRIRAALLVLFVAGVLGFALAHPFVDGLRGDGFRWANSADEPFFWASEPIGRYAHHLSFLLRRALGLGTDGGAALRASSACAGLAFALSFASLARRAFPGADPLALGLLAVLGPTSLLFVGYPETTPWAYAGVGVYLLLGLAYLDDERRETPWAATLALSLAVATHGLVLFATGAQLVLLAIGWRRGAARPPAIRIARLVACALIPFLLLGAALLYASHFVEDSVSAPALGNAAGGSDGARFVGLPGAPTPEWNGLVFHYRLFTQMHREGLLDLVLFAMPALVLAPWALLERRLRPERLFLAAATAGLLLLGVGWNADLGMLRDYDLVAAAGLPALLLVLHALAARTGRRAQQVAALVVVPLTWGVIVRPWLAP